MNNFTIAIFGNKIFFEIIREMKLFNKFRIKYYEDLNLCMKESENKDQLVVFFKDSKDEIKVKNFPLIVVDKSVTSIKKLSDEVKEQIKIPFRIIDFEKKVISLIAKSNFRKNSLIYLGDYVIDKNERKIKKNNLELLLSEKEINFLISFSKNSEPISKNSVLKDVWNYSTESETHTVETHIHRLRKKILKKFNDNNFIKNSNKGYYI